MRSKLTNFIRLLGILLDELTLNKEQYEKAIFAFGNVVCFDETHGEAWSNIASSYIHLNKMKEAQS